MKRLLLLLLSAMVIASPAAAVSQLRYTMDYTASHNIGYDPIQVYEGFLKGLDYSGEWTQYTVPALPFGTYKVTLKCWGNEVPYQLQLVTFPVAGEDPQTINFTFTGLGTSVCG